MSGFGKKGVAQSAIDLVSDLSTEFFDSSASTEHLSDPEVEQRAKRRADAASAKKKRRDEELQKAEDKLYAQMVINEFARKLLPKNALEISDRLAAAGILPPRLFPEEKKEKERKRSSSPSSSESSGGEWMEAKEEKQVHPLTPAMKRQMQNFNFIHWVKSDNFTPKYGMKKSQSPDLPGAIRITMPDGKSWIDYKNLNDWFDRNISTSSSDISASDKVFKELKSDKYYAAKRDKYMKHDVPRDQAFYYKGIAPTGYKFGGKEHKGSVDIPEYVEKFRALMESHYGPTQFVVMNRYKEGADSISAHSDNEKVIVPHSPIPSLSLGASRMFVIKPITKGKPLLPNGKSQNKLDIVLAHGDLLVMGGQFQNIYTHEIPKGFVGSYRGDFTRVNITTRRFKQ